MALRELYPPIQPYSSGFLSVSDVHNLYWEQCGNPDGIPVMALHGGPGGGADAHLRRFFDPEFFRIILFDQRGCGRSEPTDSLIENTPEALTDDIERLRLHLKLNKMHIFGGSWGSALALLYGIKYPQHCISFILHAIFLMRTQDLDWFFNGARHIFPEAWAKFSDYIPFDKRHDLLSAYHELLFSNDSKTAQNAALSWVEYEAQLCMLYPQITTIVSDEDIAHALTLARLEAHFFVHHLLDGKNDILGHIDALRAIPATILHGRYDCLSPLQGAHELHKKWPEADYIIIPDSGHASVDPSMRSRLIEITDALKHLR